MQPVRAHRHSVPLFVITAAVFFRRQMRPVCALMVGITCSISGTAASPEARPWKGTDIGGCGIPGGFSFHDGTLEIAGSGEGNTLDKDQLYFVSVTHPGGDVEVIARLATFEGSPKAAVGLMIRVANEPKAPTPAVAFGLFRVPGEKSAAGAMRPKWTTTRKKRS